MKRKIRKDVYKIIEDIDNLKRELRHKNKMIKELRIAMGVSNIRGDKIQERIMDLYESKFITKEQIDKILEYRS